MSVFKPFLATDTVISPFEVNKSFTFKGDSELTSSNVNIDRYIGENITSQYWVSGSNPTGQINIQDKALIYHSIKELYYSNYLTNPSGSLVGTASFNILSLIFLNILKNKKDLRLRGLFNYVIISIKLVFQELFGKLGQRYRMW